ncbi:MAG TPA: hypothetical protein EYG70_04230 [Sulfurimonas sp.]|nr:hypothetical protein [Sulfurimonas sp.]
MNVNILETHIPPFKVKRIFVYTDFSTGFLSELPIGAIELSNISFSRVDTSMSIGGSRIMLFPVSFNRIHITDMELNTSAVFKTTLTDASKNILLAFDVTLCSTHTVGEWLECTN